MTGTWTGRSTSWRAAAVTAVVATLVAVAAGTAAQPAHGALLACEGAESATYSPPLTNTPTPTRLTVATDYSTCVNALNLLERRTGTVSFSGNPVASCGDLLANGSGRRVVSWSTGGSSTFEYTYLSNTLPDGTLQVLQTGRIVAGEFSGSIAAGVVLLPGLQLGVCNGAGIDATDGVVTLRIVL